MTKKIANLPAIPGREMADGIMAATAELQAMMRAGKRPEDCFTVHVVGFSEPGRFSPSALLRLRKQLGLSQAAFAEAMGVSCMLVQGWERGVRTPSRLACRLLDIIAKDPAAWIASLRPTAKRPSRRAKLWSRPDDFRSSANGIGGAAGVGEEHAEGFEGVKAVLASPDLGDHIMVV